MIERGGKYRRCHNSLTGKHKWIKPSGKNAHKPVSCIHCNKLEPDLRTDIPTVEEE